MLREIRLFRDLAAEQLARLAEVAQAAVFYPGERIGLPGEPAERVYFVVQGNVQVLGQAEQDGVTAEAGIAWLGAGDTLGELSLLDEGPQPVSYVAITTTQCLWLGREAFLRVLQEHWCVTHELLRALARRAWLADRQVAEQARDPLTGLSQRRAAAEFYERELAVARRAAHEKAGASLSPFALLLVDVDRLRDINDRFGHRAGDHVLRTVAHLLTSASRATDLVARGDGDEFAVLLPGAGQAGAEEVANRIQSELCRLADVAPHFTLTTGIALADHIRQPPLSAVLAKARVALERAKRAAVSS